MKILTIAAIGLGLLASCACAQDKKGRVIIGIELDGKRMLLKFDADGKKVSATADGEELPESQIEKKGNRITIKDVEGNPVANVQKWSGGGQIHAIARSDKAAIGIELNQLPRGLADHLELDSEKVIYVTRAIKGRAAARAGLRDHDVIVELDGSSPVSEKVLHEKLGKKKPGEKLKVRVLRRGKDHDFVIRCERAKSGSEHGGLFTYTGAPLTLEFDSRAGLFSNFDSGRYSDSLKSAMMALDQMKKTGVSGAKKEYFKEIEKAKKALRQAQKEWRGELRGDPQGVMRYMLEGAMLGGKKGTKDMVLLDPYLKRRVATGNSALAKATKNNTGKKLESIEKRLDRLEGMLKQLLEKRDN